MRLSKSSVMVALLAAILLVVSTGMTGCAQTESGSQDLQEAPVNNNPIIDSNGDGFGGPSPDQDQLKSPLPRVAEILGIEEQTLEDAFAQARNETAGESTAGPQALTSRVAEILGVDQQKLEDAFNQARSEMPDGAIPQRPTDQNPEPPDATQ